MAKTELYVLCVCMVAMVCAYPVMMTGYRAIDHKFTLNRAITECEEAHKEICARAERNCEACKFICYYSCDFTNCDAQAGICKNVRVAYETYISNYDMYDTVCLGLGTIIFVFSGLIAIVAIGTIFFDLEEFEKLKKTKPA